MFLKGSLEQMTDEFLLIEWAQVASATLNSDIIYQKKEKGKKKQKKINL